MAIVLGAASPWILAATLGVSPRANCSCLPPPPIAPTTTKPVSMPTRTASLDTFTLLQTSTKLSHGIEDTQTRSYCSLRIVFMRLGIPKVHEQSITEQLSDMSIVALNNFSTHLLIRPYHVTPVFRVELRCQLRRSHQITKHHRELPTFRV